MQKTIFIATFVAALVGCAHDPPPAAPEKDWAHGLDGTLSSSIAPVGPIETDQSAYNLIRRREHERALGTKDTLVELDSVRGELGIDATTGIVTSSDIDPGSSPLPDLVDLPARRGWGRAPGLPAGDSRRARSGPGHTR